MPAVKIPAVKKPAAKKPVVKKAQPAKKVVKPVTKPAAKPIAKSVGKKRSLKEQWGLVGPEKPAVVKKEKPAAEGPSKMELAVEIYKKLIAEKKARKDVILAFIADAGLTKAGASTYFGLIKAKVNAGKL